MSGIVLTEVADATIPTPAAGKVTVYFSTEEAGPAYKDDAAAVSALAGAAGATGAAGAGYGGTSTTSLAIGTGSKAFTTQAGLAYVAGSRVRAASGADPDTDWMEGVCSAYSGTTLTVLMDLTSGSGTHTDWNLSLAGEAPAAWLGAWSGATAYTEGDAVSNDGSSYVCILGHTNQEPPNGTYWDVLAQGAGADLDAIVTASSGQDIADALAGAAAPDAGNVFATMADVGGSGLLHGYATVATDQTSTGSSFADLATAGPSVTITVNTKVKVTVSCDFYGTAADCTGNMGVDLSSANTSAASDLQKLMVIDSSAGNTGFQGSRTIYLSGLTPGSTVFKAQYYRGGSGTAHFRYREILVECMD